LGRSATGGGVQTFKTVLHILPEDDRVIETCRSVLMQILDFLNNTYIYIYIYIHIYIYFVCVCVCVLVCVIK